MRHLTVYARFITIIAVLSAVFVAVMAYQIWVVRSTVIEEREVKVLDIVETAKKILAYYDEKAKAGKLQPAEAQQLAFDAIGAMRWGPYADYIGVYGAGKDNAGITYVHSNPKYINVNRWDFKDSHGRLLIQDIVERARAGGGYVEYNVPRVVGGKEQAKLSYVSGYGSGDKSLVIQAGVYIDDIDEVIFSRAIWIAAGGLAGLLIATFTALFLGRGLVRPLDRICSVMDGLASGNLAIEVSYRDRRNEIGRISRSLGVFKDTLVDAERLREEQSGAEQRQLAQRKADMTRLADDFENAIGEIVNTVSSASTGLEESAVASAANAERSLELTTIVAAASGETSTNVQSVASATEEMALSVNEIGRQVQASAGIATKAVGQAQETNDRVGELAKAAARIGDVVELINMIAGQTNLLALNAPPSRQPAPAKPAVALPSWRPRSRRWLNRRRRRPARSASRSRGFRRPRRTRSLRSRRSAAPSSGCRRLRRRSHLPWKSRVRRPMKYPATCSTFRGPPSRCHPTSATCSAGPAKPARPRRSYSPRRGCCPGTVTGSRWKSANS
jgi:methyl-accepting chemotaxis protein